MMCDFSLNGEQILGLRYPSSEPRSIRAPTAHPTNFEYMKAALCGNKKLTIPQVLSYEVFAAYSRQAELRMMLQKLVRLNFGSCSASTSSFTVPNVVSGLWQNPS
jgi:hypothetical protein